MYVYNHIHIFSNLPCAVRKWRAHLTFSNKRREDMTGRQAERMINEKRKE